MSISSSRARTEGTNMRDESHADDASRLAVDYRVARPASSRDRDPGTPDPDARDPHYALLERAHRSVGPQGEAPRGAPRSGSA
jgi:hypothetical protein